MITNDKKLSSKFMLKKNNIKHYIGHIKKFQKIYDITSEAMRNFKGHDYSIIDNSEEIIFQTDKEGHWTFLSPAWEKITGFTVEESLGRAFLDFVYNEDLEWNKKLFELIIYGKRDYCRQEFRYITTKNELHWLEVMAHAVVNEQGHIIGSAGILLDITERKTMAQELIKHKEHLGELVNERTAELRTANKKLNQEICEHKKTEQMLKRYQLLAEKSSDIMLIIYNDGCILEANNAAIKAYGYTRQELIGMNLNRISNNDMLENHIQLAFSEGILFETIHRRKGGSTFPVEINSQSAQMDDEKVILSVIRNITKRKRIEEHLQYLATHDCLTNVLNRHSLEQLLKKIISKARRSQETSALLLIDLDNFKLVNDTYGHASGDQLLVSLIGLLKDNLYDHDVLARIGGDEFAVILEGVSAEEAKSAAEKLRRVLDENELSINKHGCSINLTTSIGIVMIDGTLDQQKLLSYADVALYDAKGQGKNTIVFINSEEDKLRVAEEHYMALLVKDAIKDNRFVLHYQPIVKMGAGVQHYEALIRMFDKNGDIIYPNTFLPIVEQFGLMSQIDRWVVTTALQTLRQTNISIFINLSGLSLGDKALLNFIEESIQQYNIDPSRLGFEITETTAVKDLVQAKRWIRRLKNIGCHFALDDFGVGFSSFSHLQILPVDYLKIDGSFVRNIDTDTTQRAIVQAMQAVAHSLGKKTIAEFVENKAVMEILDKMQINCGQGYYLGKPVPIEELLIS